MRVNLKPSRQVGYFLIMVTYIVFFPGFFIGMAIAKDVGANEDIPFILMSLSTVWVYVPLGLLFCKLILKKVENYPEITHRLFKRFGKVISAVSGLLLLKAFFINEHMGHVDIWCMFFEATPIHHQLVEIVCAVVTTFVGIWFLKSSYT